ncbi:MAG: 3'(2'),5'-bisphosphate nucleotidase CysQ [Bdellovibrionaceae bacterium]|nr:3'(2'),5'-bisphosphate nucleotidase CysQ [Pseudobdellovibrionaceae bacterium]
MIEAVTRIAIEAGAEIMAIRRSTGPTVQIKADASPVTQADLAANERIVTQLKILQVAPIVSEESALPEVVPDRFWLVDPLDGTKDFIAGRDTFVVNIALVESGKPVLGVVYAPALDELFWAQKGQGAFKSAGLGTRTTVQRIQNTSTRDRFKVLASGSQMTPRLQAFIDALTIDELTRFGSALKMCRVAEGEADLYPRFGPTSEWDTAAGQVILEEANCKLVDMSTDLSLRYGKAGFRNPGFIACRADLDFIETFRGLLAQMGPVGAGAKSGKK